MSASQFVTESTRMGWAGNAANLRETRNAYNKFFLGNIKEIIVIQTLGVRGPIISTPYMSSCCTKRHLISTQLPINIPFRFRNSVLLHLLRHKMKLNKRFNICSMEEICSDMGTGHTVVFL